MVILADKFVDRVFVAYRDDPCRCCKL